MGYRFRFCLNPCFNGRWSARAALANGFIIIGCLNPCFNGRWSARIIKTKDLGLYSYRLNPCFNGRWSAR